METVAQQLVDDIKVEDVALQDFDYSVKECEIVGHSYASMHDMLAAFFMLHASYRYQGVQVHIQDPQVILMLQASRGDRSCPDCNSTHRMLTIQRIQVRDPRNGHGTRLLQRMLTHELMVNNKLGLWLQSCITNGSRALAKRVGMKHFAYDHNGWDNFMCAF